MFDPLVFETITSNRELLNATFIHKTEPLHIYLLNTQYYVSTSRIKAYFQKWEYYLFVLH